jgi:hypothetical protein
MKSLLHFAKRLLAKHPGLRRKVVNAIYRIPLLDMRLRAVFDERDDPHWRPVDATDLPEDVRVVYARLRTRMGRR